MSIIRQDRRQSAEPPEAVLAASTTDLPESALPAAEHDAALLEEDASTPTWLVRLREMATFNYVKVRFSMMFAVLPWVFVGLLPLGVAMLLLKGLLGDDGAAGVGMAFYAAFIAAGVLVGLRRSERRRAADIRARAEGADARAIGPLATMVRGNVMAGSIFAYPVIRAIVDALQQLLSTVTPEDRGRVDEADRAALRSILASCANHYGSLQAKLYPPEFVAAALRGLTILEDVPALRVAERLTRAIGIGARADKLRSAATSALPDLRAMAERIREREQLLRPAPVGSDELLLRPAAGTSSGADTLLVRPASDDS